MVANKRRLSLTALFLLTAATARAYQIGGNPQNCNGVPVEHTGAGGTATGSGGGPRRARDAAGTNAASAVVLQLPPCANCANGEECEGGISLSWSNYQAGTPVYDEILKVWRVSCSWDCVDMTQTCNSCP